MPMTLNGTTSNRVLKVYGKIIKRIVKLEDDERAELVKLLTMFCEGYNPEVAPKQD